jgi:hypothetical protein
MRMLLLGTFLCQLLETQMFSTFSIYMTEKIGLTKPDVGLLYGLNGRPPRPDVARDRRDRRRADGVLRGVRTAPHADLAGACRDLGRPGPACHGLGPPLPHAAPRRPHLCK